MSDTDTHDEKLIKLLGEIRDELAKGNAIRLAALELQLEGRQAKVETVLSSAEEQIKGTLEQQREKLKKLQERNRD